MAAKKDGSKHQNDVTAKDEMWKKQKSREQQSKIFMLGVATPGSQGLCKPEPHKLHEPEQHGKVCEQKEQRECIPKEPHKWCVQ
eukprot:15338701-Ditylum_brightwellii.AAC.2